MQKEVQAQRKLSPAMAVAIVALILALCGSAFATIAPRARQGASAPLAKNSVGTRQLKAKAVTTGKLANNAVNSRAVAANSLTGADINLNSLGTVPVASHAESATSADKVSGHAAACPTGTVLLHGACFDSSPNPQVGSLQAAADACAAKDGYLPSPMTLYAVRGVINLGTGIGSDYQYTNTYYGNTAGGAYRTIVINGTGAMQEIEPGSAAHYVCEYALVR